MYKTEDDHLNWCLFSKVQGRGALSPNRKNSFLTLQKDEGTVSSTLMLNMWYFPFRVSQKQK